MEQNFDAELSQLEKIWNIKVINMIEKGEIDLNNISTDDLKKLMEISIEQENYECCIILKQKLDEQI